MALMVKLNPTCLRFRIDSQLGYPNLEWYN
jgi:hypothetical protein